MSSCSEHFSIKKLQRGLFFIFIPFNALGTIDQMIVEILGYIVLKYTHNFGEMVSTVRLYVCPRQYIRMRMCL